MEQLVKTVVKFPVFFDTAGSWVILFIMTSIVAFEWLLLGKVKSVFIKWITRIVLIVVSLVLCTTLFMINVPFKPMISELAKVQRLIGQPIPDFSFISARNGKTYRISDFTSKIVIINYWATYCGPCVKELPALKAIEDTFGDHVNVIALTNEDEQKVIPFLNKVKAPLFVGISTDSFLDMNGFLPATIICRNGVISEYTFGQQDFEFFKSKIK